MIPNVRQFKLINGNGAEYDMTRPEALFHAPDGLGWGTERTINRLGQTYIAIDEREIHQTPTGEMVFRTYEEYANFLSFCQVGDLVLAYRPRNTWYYVRCLISINKSEIKVDTLHLVCPVTFTLTSYWYEKVVTQTADPEESEYSKTYAYTYSYTYGKGVVNVFDIDCDLPSYFKLTIFGEATNPAWRVTVNGEIVKTGKVNTTVASNQKLVVNTNPKEMEIRKYTLINTRIGSVYGSSDFTTQRIFALPKGHCQLQILSDDETLPKVLLEVLKHV